MTSIGKKISEIRKLKGFSQEELSESAKINLRTLQRIENDITVPRGNTLRSICDVFEINFKDLLDYEKKEDNNYLIFLHLFVLTFIIIPLGNIILPLIFCLIKKDKILHLDEFGARLLNFQILWSILAFTSFYIFIHYRINHLPNSRIFIYIFYSLCLINIIYTIIISILIRKDILKKNYPTIIRFIK